MRTAKFISVLADSSTDVSVQELDGIFVRFLKDGKPRNTFVAVEQLKYATAVGHYAAMNTGKNIAISILIKFPICEIIQGVHDMTTCCY